MRRLSAGCTSLGGVPHLAGKTADKRMCCSNNQRVRVALGFNGSFAPTSPVACSTRLWRLAFASGSRTWTHDVMNLPCSCTEMAASYCSPISNLEGLSFRPSHIIWMYLYRASKHCSRHVPCVVIWRQALCTLQTNPWGCSAETSCYRPSSSRLTYIISMYCRHLCQAEWRRC